MLAQIGGEEGADGHHLQPALPRRGEAGLDQRGAEPLAAMTFRHHRMVEADHAREQVVGGEGDLAAAEVDLEPVAGRVVADGV